jgi:hypothetical protein
VSGEGEDRVGSVAEEAVKLLGALQDWAKESAGDTAGAAGAAATGAAEALRGIDEHIATGGEDCRYCRCARRSLRCARPARR